MFSVLSELNRLHIVEQLLTKPRSVNELVDSLNLRQPQVSKHLKVLADAGIVGVKPEKNKRVYALRAEPFKKLNEWLDNYRKMWEYRLDRLDQTLIKEVRRNGQK